MTVSRPRTIDIADYRNKKMDNTAPQTSSNADDCAMESGAAERMTPAWPRKRKHHSTDKDDHHPSTERPHGVSKCARRSDEDSPADEREIECSDPLLLPDVVVKKILEFVDDDTLLTGRLVCQRWNTEITSRNGLWRRRCERSGVDVKDETFTSCDDFFSVFMNLRRLLHRMSSGESWQVEDNCDGAQCAFHREMMRYCECGEDWISDIVQADIKHMKRLEKKIAVCTRYGELIVLDEETKGVKWRTETYTTDIIQKYKNTIFTVTHSGNIEVYSLAGVCQVTETGGKLEDVEEVRVHPAAPFLLVWLASDEVFLVNDEMQVFPLHLPSPQLSDQEESVKSPDAEGIEDLAFELNVDHSDGHLAVAIQRRSTMCFVIVTTSGDILHHVFVEYDRLIEKLAPLLPGQGRYQFVCLSEKHLVTHSVQFGSSRVAVEQVWRKAIPARFADWPPGTISAGREFLLKCCSTTLQVFRMDDGTLAADIPGFLSSYRVKLSINRKSGLCPESMDKQVWYVQQAEASLKEDCEAGKRPEVVYILNTTWLNRLSPSTTQRDLPVAVIFSRENPRGKCLRWSEGLLGKTFPCHLNRRVNKLIDVTSD